MLRGPWGTILHLKSGLVGPLGPFWAVLGRPWALLERPVGPNGTQEAPRSAPDQSPSSILGGNGHPRGPFWDHFGLQKWILRRDVNSQGVKGRKSRFANTRALFRARFFITTLNAWTLIVSRFCILGKIDFSFALFAKPLQTVGNNQHREGPAWSTGRR